MNIDRFPYQNGDPSLRHFQHLEDLATGYWYSEVLFAALSLKLFDAIEADGSSTEAIAQTADCRVSPLARLLRVLDQIDLIHRIDSGWINSQLARRYLISDQPDYMGEFLLYRRYIQPRWQDLARQTAKDPERKGLIRREEDSYEERNLAYTRAMDVLARLKSAEIETALAGEKWSGPILDVGGGAGAICRRLIKGRGQGEAVLFDLPEVIAAARRIYPKETDWQGIQAVAGDFRHPPFPDHASFGLIVLSNFLHAYDEKPARRLLAQTTRFLAPEGLLLVHDYFPDRGAGAPAKGSLYDLNMMLNTFDGKCHVTRLLSRWLASEGMSELRVIDLPSDTSLVMARRRPAASTAETDLSSWVYRARGFGFGQAVLMDAGQVVTAPWVRVKCHFGCSRYAHGWQCPPHSPSEAQTAALLKDYATALLVAGVPPSRQFHQQLLKLERAAFLDGFHKALAFGAGPCSLCETCPMDRPCRFPQQSRPSMEASGIDVYATTRAAGIRLEPVTEHGQYVKYIGLLLME